MKKIDKRIKDMYEVFHNHLIIFYSSISLLFFFFVFLIYFRAHWGYLGTTEDHTKSLSPKDVIKYPLSEKFADSIKDSAEILSQNANLIIGIVTAFGIVFTLLFQLIESKKQNFRTNFFEYLKIHRENIQQIETRGKRGHDAFIDILNELNYVYTNFPSNTNSYQAYRLEWSYLFVFFGLGRTSTPIVREYIQKKYPSFNNEVDQVINYLTDLKSKYTDHNFSSKINVLGYTFSVRERNSEHNLKCILDGHQSDLGHYYRHLYQTITYIDEFPTLYFFERYSYAKNIRAQFSNHSIALFIINAYSPLGNIWINGKLIEKYHLIKNLPVSLLIPFGKDVRKDFPNIEFEM
ncbi:putative phage abortive infection protein [Sphingobacterium sp. GVS05A]|uniref:putative phage abortive infection protein n=1 Tax=Sphingobacterium sp. GVS05A TaxID=2862679 RepID=UPI001CC1042E|nr:putative phage abortive infection protein [Sphingobacterium sp. GVS05A]